MLNINSLKNKGLLYNLIISSAALTFSVNGSFAGSSNRFSVLADMSDEVAFPITSPKKPSIQTVKPIPAVLSTEAVLPTEEVSTPSKPSSSQTKEDVRELNRPKNFRKTFLKRVDKEDVFAFAKKYNASYELFKEWMYKNDRKLFKELVIGEYVQNEGVFNLRFYKAANFVFNIVAPTAMHVCFAASGFSFLTKFGTEFAWRTVGKGFTSLLASDNAFENYRTQWSNRTRSTTKDRLEEIWDQSKTAEEFLSNLKKQSYNLYSTFEENGYFDPTQYASLQSKKPTSLKGKVWNFVDNVFVKKQSRKSTLQKIWWDYIVPPLRSAVISEYFTKPYIAPVIKKYITLPFKDYFNKGLVQPFSRGASKAASFVRSSVANMTSTVDNLRTFFRVLPSQLSHASTMQFEADVFSGIPFQATSTTCADPVINRWLERAITASDTLVSENAVNTVGSTTLQIAKEGQAKWYTKLATTTFNKLRLTPGRIKNFLKARFTTAIADDVLVKNIRNKALRGYARQR